MISCGAGLLALIIFINYRTKHIKLGGIETQAKVVKITETNNGAELGYSYVIVLGYHGGGEYHEVSIPFDKEYKQGDTLTIKYQPDSPKKFIIVSEAGKKLMVISVFFGLLSLAAITGGLFLLFSDVIFAE
jgi:hypothetical protein